MTNPTRAVRAPAGSPRLSGTPEKMNHHALRIVPPDTMKRFLPVLAAVLFAMTAAPAAELPAWPQANGPFGNFNPRQSGVKLVVDLRHARQLWVSEANGLGRAKGSASGYVDMLADPATHAGSASGLIVAEGKVFASSFRPRGDAWAERMPNIAKSLGRYSGERLAALKRNTALDADDLTIAVDFTTGKTVWQAVEAGRG